MRIPADYEGHPRCIELTLRIPCLGDDEEKYQPYEVCWRTPDGHFIEGLCLVELDEANHEIIIYKYTDDHEAELTVLCRVPLVALEDQRRMADLGVGRVRMLPKE